MNAYSSSKRMLAGILLCSHALMSCGINPSLDKQSLVAIEETHSQLSLNSAIERVISQGEDPMEVGTEVQQEVENDQQLALQALTHESIVLVEEKEAINPTAVQTISSSTQYPYIEVISEALDLINNQIAIAPIKPLQPNSSNKQKEGKERNIKQTKHGEEISFKQSKEGKLNYTQKNREDSSNQAHSVQASHKETSTISYDTNQLGFFEVLPWELLGIILDYAGLEAMGQLRLLNQSFYTVMTGYEKPGLLGIQHNQQTISLHTEIRRGKTVMEGEFMSFNKKITLKNVSSVVFFQLIRGARNLPERFWSYLKGTNVQMLNLSDNQIGDLGAEMLGKALQGTNVQMLNLNYNKIGEKGAKTLGKALKGTNVQVLSLNVNQIGAQGAEKLGKALQGTKVHTLHLGSNYIGAQGAEMLGKALKGTNVHTLDLFGNEIGDLGAEMLGKTLQGTNIHTLDLHFDQIGDLGAEMLGKVLKGTNVHTLHLFGNQIGNKGAEMLGQALQGTNVHTLDLGGNQIGDLGAEMLGKALQGTNVHTLDLTLNQIEDKGAEMLSKVLQGTDVILDL